MKDGAQVASSFYFSFISFIKKYNMNTTSRRTWEAISMITEWFRDRKSPLAAFLGKLFIAYFDKMAVLKINPETIDQGFVRNKVLN